MAAPEYAVGIDLGTSNCALACLALGRPTERSVVTAIRQRTGPGSEDEREVLPSCLYRAPDSQGEWIPGAWARDMAVLQPGRVILSAKSWLCHPAVDRQGKLLPWQSEDLDPSLRLSPVAASALLLRHLRITWERAHGRSLTDQAVVVTVPASFDAAAQQLTLEAAREAGYPAGTRLMEEPQAAFYRWLEAGHAPEPGILLVVDIGGGTTDFSLFDIAPGEPPAIRRLAVGEHLLLGGDNLDRALAAGFRQELEQNGCPPGARAWGALLDESRRLKEALLTPGAPLPAEIILPAEGRGLFAASRSLPVLPEPLRASLLDGFFPEVDPADRPRKPRAGLRELGLPYAADSAITRHLAAFLDGHPRVDFLLCNGGTLRPGLLRDRLLQQITRWQGGHAPRLLDNPEPDLAVARGAAVYAARRLRHEGLLEAGSAQSIYLALADSRTRETRHLCIVARGSAPETVTRIEDHPLRVRVDTPVRFQAWSSPRRPADAAGDLPELDASELHPLPAMETRIALPPGSPKAANNLLQVAIEARWSDLGLLHVRLVSQDKAWKGKGAWELAFHLRGATTEPPPPTQPPPPGRDDAAAALRQVFGKKTDNDPRAARHLFGTLETTLGTPRRDWTPALCRSLWPALAEGLTRRNRSKDHEAAWLSLAGFLLRPGFGHPLDDTRLDELWRLHALGLAFPREPRNLTQLWILWRRVAAGLDPPRQRLLAEAWLGPLLSPGPVSLERIRLAGALERVPADTKAAWLDTWTRRLPRAARDEAAAIAWSLGRLLSRFPFGGGPEDILPPAQVEHVLHALDRQGSLDPSLPELRQALLRACRLTGLPGLDIPSPTRNRVASLLAAHLPASELLPLHEIVPVEDDERRLLFGEALPPGLLLVR